MTETDSEREVDLDRLKTFVESRVDPGRWDHIQGVVETGVTLSENYPAIASREIRLAGYLHDVAKNLSRETQKQLATRYRGTLDPVVAAVPGLWHAPASAQLGVDEFGLSPSSTVIQAVAFHPTGHRPMTDLLKGLMVADFSEPQRNFPEARTIRQQIGQTTLTELAGTVISHKITHCLEKKRLVHPWSVEAHNELCD